MLINFDCHIKNETKVSFYHLRNTAEVRLFLSQADTEKSKKKAISKPQLMRNAAARVPGREHTSLQFYNRYIGYLSVKK